MRWSIRYPSNNFVIVVTEKIIQFSETHRLFMRNKVNNLFLFKHFTDVALRLRKCDNYKKKLQYIINIRIAMIMLTLIFIRYWIKALRVSNIFFHILTSTKIIRNCEICISNLNRIYPAKAKKNDLFFCTSVSTNSPYIWFIIISRTNNRLT